MEFGRGGVLVGGVGVVVRVIDFVVVGNVANGLG